MYHTRPEAAALMAHLAIPGNLDWSDPETVTGYHLADYSCGTGELLTAAYRRVRELHRRAGGNPSLVHAAMLENAITAVDVRIIGIAGFEEQDSTFSHDTYIAEIMVVARRTRLYEHSSKTGCFINLKRRPGDGDSAARLAGAIDETVEQLESEPLGTVRELVVDGRSEGTVVWTILPKNDIWPLSRVLDPTLVQAVEELRQGRLTPGNGENPVRLPITALGDQARIGPTKYEVERLLGPETDGNPTFPILTGHDCAAQRTMGIPTPGEMSLPTGPEKGVTRTIGRLHLNDNFRYNSQSTTAMMTSEPSVGGRCWPNIRLEDEQQEKALALWLNTSLGLVAHWTLSNHTQNGLGYLSRKQIRNLPVLDITRLSPQQLDRMEEIFDRVKELPLLPANEAWRDRIRAELDRRVLEEVLGLGEEATELVRSLCNRWCFEPTVQGRKGRVAKRQPDMAELAELAGAEPLMARPTHRTHRTHRADAGEKPRTHRTKISGGERHPEKPLATNSKLHSKEERKP